MYIQTNTICKPKRHRYHVDHVYKFDLFRLVSLQLIPDNTVLAVNCNLYIASAVLIPVKSCSIMTKHFT